MSRLPARECFEEFGEGGGRRSVARGEHHGFARSPMVCNLLHGSGVALSHDDETGPTFAQAFTRVWLIGFERASSPANDDAGEHPRESLKDEVR